MTEPVNFIFHIIKVSNFRHRLAFKQVVRFYSPSVYDIGGQINCFLPGGWPYMKIPGLT